MLSALTSQNWQRVNNQKIKHKSLIRDRHNQIYAIEFWLVNGDDLFVKLNEWQIVSQNPTKLMIKKVIDNSTQTATFEI